MLGIWRKVMYEKKCSNPTNNPRCKKVLSYSNKYTYLASVKNGVLCATCASILMVATKRKNGTLKHSDKAKKNISEGLKSVYESGEWIPWNKGLSAQTDARVAKTGKSRPGELNPNYQLGYYKVWVDKYGKELADIKNVDASKKKARIGQNNGMFGKHHTEESINKMCNRRVTPETRKKLRLAYKKRLERICTNGQISPFYNPGSIPIIEQYGTEHGYNFQHAENGGEFYIKELGYWVDGYDEEKNVVIEYDEKHHFGFNDKLNTKDVHRQNEIIKEKNCKFIRIKYDGTITKIEYQPGNSEQK